MWELTLAAKFCWEEIQTNEIKQKMKMLMKSWLTVMPSRAVHVLNQS